MVFTLPDRIRTLKLRELKICIYIYISYVSNYKVNLEIEPTVVVFYSPFIPIRVLKRMRILWL